MIAFSGLDTKGVTLIADKGYRSKTFESELNQAGVTLIRPNLKSEKPRGGRPFLKAFRQIDGGHGILPIGDHELSP